MATPALCKAYNDLRQDIVILLDLQSHMQKKEYELRLLGIQKENLEKEIAERPPVVKEEPLEKEKEKEKGKEKESDTPLDSSRDEVGEGKGKEKEKEKEKETESREQEKENDEKEKEKAKDEMEVDSHS